MVADIRAKAKEHKKIETITAAQAEKLMEHVSAHEGGRYARFFALALFAGIRPEGELRKLEERDIDLANGVIKIHREVSKVKQARQITIHANLRSWLEKYSDQPLNEITEYAYGVIKKAYAPATGQGLRSITSRGTRIASKEGVEGVQGGVASRTSQRRRGPLYGSLKTAHDTGRLRKGRFVESVPGSVRTPKPARHILLGARKTPRGVGIADAFDAARAERRERSPLVSNEPLSLYNGCTRQSPCAVYALPEAHPL